tara:strand:+ start:428 stop:658 length:231 start_codon:yes stop_codon:yes gene_type:complete
VASERNSGVYGRHHLLQTNQFAMSFFGRPIRNGVSIGLGSIISFLSGYADATVQNNLLTEISDNLVQEDGGLILLE